MEKDIETAAQETFDAVKSALQKLDANAVRDLEQGLRLARSGMYDEDAKPIQHSHPKIVAQLWTLNNIARMGLSYIDSGRMGGPNLASSSIQALLDYKRNPGDPETFARTYEPALEAALQLSVTARDASSLVAEGGEYLPREIKTRMQRRSVLVGAKMRQAILAEGESPEQYKPAARAIRTLEKIVIMAEGASVDAQGKLIFTEYVYQTPRAEEMKTFLQYAAQPNPNDQLQPLIAEFVREHQPFMTQLQAKVNEVSTRRDGEAAKLAAKHARQKAQRGSAQR